MWAFLACISCSISSSTSLSFLLLFSIVFDMSDSSLKTLSLMSASISLDFNRLLSDVETAVLGKISRIGCSERVVRTETIVVRFLDGGVSCFR